MAAAFIVFRLDNSMMMEIESFEMKVLHDTIPIVH